MQRLRVPRHRAALARDVEAHRELAPGELPHRRIAHEGELHRIAPHRVPGATVTLALPPKVTGRLVPLTSRGAAHLQADEDAVEGDRLGAEDVGEAQARLPSPDVRPHDQAEGLVAGAGCRHRKGESLVRLRRGIADRIGALGGGRPAHDPFLALLAPRGRRAAGSRHRQDQTGEPPHGASSSCDSLRGSCMPGLAFNS